MKNNYRETILAYLTDNPGSSETAIASGTKLKGKAIKAAVESLVADGTVTSDDNGLLTVAESKPTLDEILGQEPVVQPTETVTKEQEEATGEKGAEVEAETETQPAAEAKTKAKPKGRDNGKYLFGGETLGKGPLVRAVVKDYVAKNPDITHEGLKEVFPDELLHRFGIFQEVDRAKKYYGNRDRFFLKDEHRIKLADKTVAVCSQFTATNIEPFLNKAKELGYVIENV